MTGSVPADRPAPDPSKLLDQWMEWEHGDESPGQALANLKKGGLREVLEALVATIGAAAESANPGAKDA